MINFLKRLLAGERLAEPVLSPPGFIQPRIATIDPAEITEVATPAPQPDVERFSDLSDRAFVLVYRDVAGVVTERRVICRVVYEVEGVRYMQAHCLERNAPRCFRIDRIRELYCGVEGVLLGAPNVVLSPFGLSAVRPTRNHMPTAIERRVRNGVRLLMTLARCDGHLHPNELLIVERFVDAAMPANSPDAVKAAIKAYAHRLAPSFETFLDVANVALKPDKRGALLLASARDLIGSDGKISEEERALIADLESLMSRKAEAI
jgi:hypothetical protein